MKQFYVRKYRPEDANRWNQLVALSRNGTFLFDRGYMEYHSDRFTDFSLVVLSGTEIVAAVPACQVADEVVSHGGLTYGGIIIPSFMDFREIALVFRAILEFLCHNGIARFLLKRIPWCHLHHPDDEFDYLAFVVGASIVRCDLSVCVDIQSPRCPVKRSHRKNIEKAYYKKVEVTEMQDLDFFWKQILVPNRMSRYGVQPTHRCEEMKMLKLRFPNNILQFGAYDDSGLVGGATVFVKPNAIHTQYLACTERGREVGAIHLLINHLMEITRKMGKRYLSFGISNENEGRIINLNLYQFKEAFGGQGVACRFFQINPQSYRLLDRAMVETTAIVRSETNGR